MQTRHTIRTLDLFCGAGGSSWGAQSAGADVVAGIDLSAEATVAYARNFGEGRAIEGRLEQIDPVSTKRKVGRIDLLLASPECTNHSPAKGNAPRCEASKQTALQVVRFAEVFRPRWVVVENVVNMRRWSRYQQFLGDLASLGYNLCPVVLNAADFGVPQARRRLFILADRRDEPQLPRPSRRQTRVAATASRVIRFKGPYAWTPLRAAGRARGTLARADRAIAELGRREPFILVYYGSDGSGGWQPLERPLRTLTTLDRFAIVRPTPTGHMMRMLQVPELKTAMGMPQRFVAGTGSRRDQIRAIGNAVCPPVMRAVVRGLTGPRT